MTSRPDERPTPLGGYVNDDDGDEEGQKVMGYYTTKLAFQRLQGRDAWTAQHTELVGCHAVRGTAAEALRALDDEREAWIEHARSRSVYIPDPERVLPLFIMTLGTDSTEVHEREAIEAIEDYTKRLADSRRT